MNPQQQLAFIKSKCIEANGSILELTFGCEIRTLNENMGNPVHTYCGDDLYRDSNYVSLENDDICASRGKDMIVPEYSEIIGRPIQLSDVLLAIGKVEHEVIFKESISENHFVIKCKSIDDSNGFCLWNLLLPLDGQSEEVWAFLYELLSK